MKQHMALDGTAGAGARRTSFRQKPDGKADPAGEAGWYLQYERERRGETLADAAIETRIKAKYLHALELGALDQVPGWPYVIGYVRSYAKFLGLEPEPLVQHYLTFVRRPAVIERFAGRSLWFRQHAASRTTAAFAATAMVTVLGLWAFMSDEPGTLVGPPNVAKPETALAEAPPPAADPVITGSIGPAGKPSVALTIEPEPTRDSTNLDAALPTLRIREKSMSGPVSVPRPIPKSSVMQSDVETALANEGTEEVTASDLGAFIATQVGGNGAASAEPNKDASPTAAAGSSRIVLRARTNVWVRIEDEGGNALVSQTLPKGEVYHVPDRTGLVLIVRDAGALEYSLDGKPYARLGSPGQILVSHPLVPDKISAIGG